MRNIILNTDSEAVFRLQFLQFIVDRFDHRRGKVLRGKSIASADDHDLRATAHRLNHIHVKGFSGCSRLFAAIQHSDGLNGGGESVQEAPHIKGTIEANHEKAYLFSLGDQMLNGFAGNVGPGTHHHDNAIGIPCTKVVEQVVLPSNLSGKTIHCPLKNIGSLSKVRGTRLTRLEERIGILCRSANKGIFRGETAVTMLLHQFVINQSMHIILLNLLDFHNLMAGAETIKKMDDGQTRLQRRHLSDQSHVHDFLHGGGAEHAPTGPANSHNIGVVSKDRERMGRQRTSRNVHNRAGELACNFVHIGDHQQKPLRSRERGSQCSGLQRTVIGPCRSGLTLHFSDLRHGAPNILPPLRTPLVSPFTHIG